MDIKITYPDIELKVGNKVLKLESFTANVNSKGLRQQITRPVNSFVQQLTGMLYSIDVDIEVGERKASVHLKTTVGGSNRKWYYSPTATLEGILSGMLIDVKFGSKLHNQLVQCWQGGVNSQNAIATSCLDLGLCEKVLGSVRLTEKGEAVLKSLRNTKLSQAQELTVIIELLDRLKPAAHISFNMWNYNGRMDFLAHNDYIICEDSFSGKYHITAKGQDFIKERSTKLIRKELAYNELIPLLHFLPIELLPKFLTHENENIRAAARR